MLRKMLLSLLICALCSCTTKAPVQELTKSQPLKKEMQGDAKHEYQVTLEKGQLARVVVDQQGIDVVVTIYGPDGKKLQEMDSPNGLRGSEAVAFPAETAGAYRVEVKSLDPKAASGHYEIILKTLLTAAEYTERNIKLDPAIRLSTYAVFQLAPDRLIFTGPTTPDFGGESIAYMDSQTRRFGIIYPLADGSFYGTTTLMEPYDEDVRVRFNRDTNNAIVSLDWQETGQEKRQAQRIFPSHREDVSFTNGAVMLKGNLLLPDAPGPHPMIVTVHGSGPGTRHWGPFTSYFLQFGMGVLSFDKRGAGESTGDWKTSSLDDLANDIIAGIAYLKTRSDVDSTQIGLFGVSQGGWVGSLTAAKSSDVKFLIINTGSGVPVYENMVHETETSLRDMGFPDEQLREWRALSLQTGKMISDGESPEKVKAALEAIKDKPWASLVNIGAWPPDHYMWTWLKLNGNVDTGVLLEQVECPVLWFLGDHDSQVPTKDSEPRLNAALTKAGNPDFTIKVLSPAAHVLWETKTGYMSEVMTSANKFVPGYLDTMTEWIKTRIILAAKQRKKP